MFACPLRSDFTSVPVSIEAGFPGLGEEVLVTGLPVLGNDEAVVLLFGRHWPIELRT